MWQVSDCASGAGHGFAGALVVLRREVDGFAVGLKALFVLPSSAIGRSRLRIFVGGGDEIINFYYVDLHCLYPIDRKTGIV